MANMDVKVWWQALPLTGRGRLSPDSGAADIVSRRAFTPAGTYSVPAKCPLSACPSRLGGAGRTPGLFRRI